MLNIRTQTVTIGSWSIKTAAILGSSWLVSVCGKRQGMQARDCSEVEEIRVRSAISQEDTGMGVEMEKKAFPLFHRIFKNSYQD